MQKVNDTKDFSNTIARYDSPVFDNYYGFDKNQPADRQIVILLIVRAAGERDRRAAFSRHN